MTSSSWTTAAARFSATVAPVTVIAPVSSTGSSCLISARAPPAASNCSIESSPLGRTALSTGTSSPSSLKSPKTSRSRPASIAVACRCLMQLIEPLTASTAAAALRKAPGVMMSRGLRSSSTISTMRGPERRAMSNIFGLLARTGAAPGSAMPSASTATCIELAVAMPEHTPGPRIALSAIAAQPVGVELAERGLHAADEDVLDVDVLAVELAARLVAADDEDGRDVEAARRHEVRGRGLVARGQADHAVELRALDRDLHVVHDEVARGQDVAARAARADDEVARRRGADLEGQAAGGADRLLDDRGDAVEVAEADRQLRGAVDDRDLGLLDVGVGQAERLPLRAPHRLAHDPGSKLLRSGRVTLIPPVM